MTTIYRIKDFETEWTSKWNEDKDAVIKQLDDYVDSYLCRYSSFGLRRH